MRAPTRESRKHLRRTCPVALRTSGMLSGRAGASAFPAADAPAMACGPDAVSLLALLLEQTPHRGFARLPRPSRGLPIAVPIARSVGPAFRNCAQISSASTSGCRASEFQFLDCAPPAQHVAQGSACAFQPEELLMRSNRGY